MARCECIIATEAKFVGRINMSSDKISLEESYQKYGVCEWCRYRGRAARVMEKGKGLYCAFCGNFVLPSEGAKAIEKIKELEDED